MSILTRQQVPASNDRMALTATSQTEMIYPIKLDQTSNPLLVYPTVDRSRMEWPITLKYDEDHVYFDVPVVTPSYVPLICALFAGVIWFTFANTSGMQDGVVTRGNLRGCSWDCCVCHQHARIPTDGPW